MVFSVGYRRRPKLPFNAFRTLQLESSADDESVTTSPQYLKASIGYRSDAGLTSKSS
jgi:hypothetical protein